MSGDVGGDHHSESSTSFFEGIAWTPQIEEAAQIVALWMTCDLCGAGFWGLPRVGKSEFSKYLEKVASEMFGGTVAVVLLNFDGEVFDKPEKFLVRALVNLDVRAITARLPAVLRVRLVDAIWEKCTPKTERVLVIADEMQNVAPAVYGQFAILESNIAKRFKPFMLVIGQPELQSTVANLRKSINVTGRLYQEVREFCGLSFQQLEEFLRVLDGEESSFTMRHFPGRAVGGWSIVQLVAPIKAAVLSLVDLDKLGLDLFLPMAIVRSTLIYLFLILKDEANVEIEVGAEHVLEAFQQNGFVNDIMAYTKPKRPDPPKPSKRPKSPPALEPPGDAAP
ncbi:hypothetical protein [Roseateles toxinivorans]|uniref:AAA domain-containing protein n=1 Tax=Roseateles toxinivorans TaxID=270368 RepID=A0A4R6QUK6_9BURK|nr:hypothetical protein [Roseateles toxinivorans]TDP74749.1 hypothetical protein DES47_101815 [Roseateles toxinivorans]